MDKEEFRARFSKLFHDKGSEVAAATEEAHKKIAAIAGEHVGFLCYGIIRQASLFNQAQIVLATTAMAIDDEAAVDSILKVCERLGKSYAELSDTTLVGILMKVLGDKGRSEEVFVIARTIIDKDRAVLTDVITHIIREVAKAKKKEGG